jgi:2-ketoarginine methyltransferase
LIENTQPIRQFFLAQAIYHALELGVFGELGAEPGQEATKLACALGLDAERLTGLLCFLQNEGYVVDEAGWRLTVKGSELPVFTAWYKMLVGGYAPTMLQLSDALRSGAPWATRDTKQVGIGSCGIGRYDAVPLVQRLLDGASDITTVVDLGCGDAGFLIDIMETEPTIRGIGVEPHLASIEAAELLRTKHKISDRLDLYHGPAADVGKLNFPDQGRGVCFMTAFVLQEMLEQDGEVAVEELLRSVFKTYPEARWIVVEMDRQADAPIMGHGLALAFYNPYFLIHTVTEQRLESRQWWTALFDRVGLVIQKLAHPDERADTAGIQFGVLLKRPDSATAARC